MSELSTYAHWCLNRLFPVEEINGHGRSETYLFRWTLLATRWGKVYVHRMVGDDWAREPHDHPKRFLSIGLAGGYEEERWTHCPGPDFELVRLQDVEYRAPWIRHFPARHIHRLRTEHCWTLVIVGRSVREWGFWRDGEWVEWYEYVESHEMNPGVGP